MSAEVDLGFLEKCEPWLLESRFFPSKVGGKPAWLDLKNIPDAKDVECDYCGDPCVFLCQVYAPEDDTAFHRTLYVFVCRNLECCRPNQNGNLKVLRSQMERENPFYPYDPPVEESTWGTDIKAEKWTKTCFVCGIAAPNHCSQCKVINYCSRAHQVYDWKHGHKESCGSDEHKESDKLLFPEYKIIIETEDDGSVTSDEDNAEKEEKEIKKYEEMKKRGKAGTFQDEDVQDELAKMANQKEDETFIEFRLAIDKYPDQVIRYSRNGEVLYISSENKVTEVPKCPECNSDRKFEFQVMPQLLNFLGFDNALKSIDWGILAVYTCEKSCVPKEKYCKEFIWKQDIVQNDAD